MPAVPTILVVDDLEDVRFFHKRSLERMLPGCQVIAHASADDALAELQRGTRVDAIVTDNDLGRTTGSALIAQIRGLGVGCPIVMVTFSSNPQVTTEALAAGATRVFDSGGDDFARYLKDLLTGVPPQHP